MKCANNSLLPRLCDASARITIRLRRLIGARCWLRWGLPLSASLWLCLTAQSAVAQMSASTSGVGPYTCGDLQPRGQFGPYDYRTIDSDTRHRVEDYHFPPKVELLIEGSAGPVGGDLDYTLRAFPNNPRALLAMSRFATKSKTERPVGARFMVECYFERAIRFVPDDPMPHVLYASYLKDRRRLQEARAQLDEAEKLRGDPADFDLDYNLGLTYFEVGAYDRAAVAAKRAYALGAPLPALRKKLQSVGKWSE